MRRSVFCWAYLEVFFLLAWRASCKDETFFVVLQRFFFFARFLGLGRQRERQGKERYFWGGFSWGSELEKDCRECRERTIV